MLGVTISQKKHLAAKKTRQFHNTVKKKKKAFWRQKQLSLAKLNYILGELWQIFTEYRFLMYKSEKKLSF